MGNSLSALFNGWIVVTSHNVGDLLLESVSHGLRWLRKGNTKQVVKVLLLLLQNLFCNLDKKGVSEKPSQCGGVAVA